MVGKHFYDIILFQKVVFLTNFISQHFSHTIPRNDKFSKEEDLDWGLNFKNLKYLSWKMRFRLDRFNNNNKVYRETQNGTFYCSFKVKDLMEEFVESEMNKRIIIFPLSKTHSTLFNIFFFSCGKLNSTKFSFKFGPWTKTSGHHCYKSSKFDLIRYYFKNCISVFFFICCQLLPPFLEAEK